MRRRCGEAAADADAESQRAPYHHGDLRTALIEAATKLIRDNRVETFTVAEAARAAGVSSGAPYRHFADRDALLDAVAAEGFARLKAETETAMGAHPPGSIESLVAGGSAYVAFGASEPELFHLMWGATRPHAEGGLAHQTGARCYGGFIERLTAIMQAQGLGDRDPHDFGAPLWGMVHGFASLLIGRNPMLGADLAEVQAKIGRATRAYFAGARAGADIPAP
jgi:AcrR family transcriptional regulator